MLNGGKRINYMCMIPKDIYIMGRAEYLSEYKGYSLTEGCKIAEKEWEEAHKQINFL